MCLVGRGLAVCKFLNGERASEPWYWERIALFFFLLPLWGNSTWFPPFLGPFLFHPPLLNAGVTCEMTSRRLGPTWAFNGFAYTRNFSSRNIKNAQILARYLGITQLQMPDPCSALSVPKARVPIKSALLARRRKHRKEEEREQDQKNDNGDM